MREKSLEHPLPSGSETSNWCSPYSTEVILWVMSFCFATCAALLFQKFLLPLVPSLHAGHGLMDGDASYFHSVATALADKIRHEGWRHWQIFPAPGATGNVAILAALYALFGNDPSLIVPINAAIHATSGVLIYRIGMLLAPGRAGHIAGLVTAALFIVFPSALNWYGQVHKDGFAIAGTLFAIHAWLFIEHHPSTRQNWLHSTAQTCAAVLLITFVRPYNLLPLFAVMATLSVIVLLMQIRRRATDWKKLSIYFFSLVILGGGASFANHYGVKESYTYEQLAATGYLGDWAWKPTAWAPRLLESYVEVTARTRAGLIVSGKNVNAGSMMDVDVAPDNLVAVAAYGPRALQIALFAPFPSQWLDKISAARLVATVETMVWYLIVPGVVFAAIHARNAVFLLTVAFAIQFLFIYGFSIANLGTLYRIRYPFLFLLMLIGVTGWTKFILRIRNNRAAVAAPCRSPDPAPGTEPGIAGRSRTGIFSAGMTVAILTALTYAAFLLRDIIFAKWIGIGASLDALFVASAIPMFLVAAFSIPLGTILIPSFLTEKAQRSPLAAQRLVSSVSAIYAAVMVPVSVALYFSAPTILSFTGTGFSSETERLAVSLFRWTLPILVLSGYVVICNAVLNALGDYAVAAAGQIVVPVIAIIAFLIFGSSFGIVAAVAGMLAGQIFNLWLVSVALHRRAYTPFSLRIDWIPALRSMGAQYLPLVAAALFINLAAPINVYMASGLAEGNAATLGLGGKLVIFVTGIVGATVATVILPHFSSFMARNQLLDARSELSFFLLATTVITIPPTLLFFAGSETIVRLAFEGGLFRSGDAQSVARVMANGVLQLPFYTVNLLILKFAIATRHAGRIMVVSLLGLVVNIALNITLMPAFGAAGIALATTIATALSSCFMLLFFYRLGHIASVDIAMISLNGLLFTTLVICWHYHSPAGIGVSLIGLAVLQYGQWKWLVSRKVSA